MSEIQYIWKEYAKDLSFRKLRKFTFGNIHSILKGYETDNKLGYTEEAWIAFIDKYWTVSGEYQNRKKMVKVL